MPMRRHRWGLGTAIGAFIAMASIAVWAAPALGQGGQQIVAGSVVQITGNRITVGANAGPVTVQTGPATRYEKEGPGTLADLRPDLPDDFIRIVERACEPDADRRYSTIAGVKEALSRTLGWDTWTRKHTITTSGGGPLPPPRPSTFRCGPIVGPNATRS